MLDGVRAATMARVNGIAELEVLSGTHVYPSLRKHRPSLLSYRAITATV